MSIIKKNEFYSLKNILKEKAQYNVIFGGRSNGKSYAVKTHILEDFWKSNCKNQGAIIRRWREDFQNKGGATLFNDVTSDGFISNLTNGEYNGVVYYRRAWYLACYDEEKEKWLKQERPFAYSFALTEMEHDKSASFPDVTNILFDEFMSRTGYLPDEFVQFMNVLSTIIRFRDNITIFMVGNTVNKYCPYFGEMGLTHIDEMKPGQIDVYKYGERDLKVAVEYAESLKHNKANSKYFAFDNSRLDMITNGAWEIGMYPHKPIDFAPKDIQFIYFIEFNNEKLQCEIVMKDDYNFTYIHRKTGKYKNSDDLVFSTEETSPLMFRTRKINQALNKTSIVTKICSYFTNEKVFYQDNVVGEIVRNYIKWCKTDGILA